MVGECAGGDDAHHFALYRPLAGDFAHLLANGHAATELNQLGQILFGGVVGHAGHFNRLAIDLATCGEGDIEQTGCLNRIIQKQFVKIAHAVKHQFVLVFGLDGQILRHHWR